MLKCCQVLKPKICAGNNPWPIGVTSVGIHERSSREKISHVMNGAAHIMNDEATRKYLQAVKRLLTFCQRAYPTDPSRCIDFDGFRNPSRGAAGGGSDKMVCASAMPHGLCLGCESREAQHSSGLGSAEMHWGG